MKEMKHLELDDILAVLGNPTRRRILRLLSEEPRYAFQLAQILGITQRAIQKHLKILEELGIVESETQKSNVGPERKYYRISRNVLVSLSFGPNIYFVQIKHDDETENLSLEKLNEELQEIFHDRIPTLNLFDQLEMHELISQLTQIDTLLSEYLTRYQQLLKIREILQDNAEKLFAQILKNPNDLRIITNLLQVLGRLHGDFSMDRLCEILDLSKNEILRGLQILEANNILEYRIDNLTNPHFIQIRLLV